MLVIEARARFFERSDLGPDGGYRDRWVKVKSKPIPFFFPNVAGRVAAAKLHDLHHIVNEYETDWTGEAEIAAWEIASGCGRFFWAWLLNLGGFTIGIFNSPRRLWRAFVRGRHSRNLYGSPFDEAQMRSTTVGELRKSICSSVHAGSTTSDAAHFLLWCVIGLLWHGVILAIFATALWFGIRIRWIPSPFRYPS